MEASAPDTTRIKFCGMTRLEDARRAADLGAWAIGLIFYPGSPRRCELDEAIAIAGELRRRVEVAGVFVNATLEEIAATADAAPISLVQLHGDEGPVFAGEVARRTGCRVIKAARVRSGAEIQALAAFKVDFHLLDAHADGLYGGTGTTFGWDLARRHRGSALMIVSGGLTPENVGEAIAVARPFAVDVAGGVEAAPGIKDHERMRAFAQAVETAGAGAPA